MHPSLRAIIQAFLLFSGLTLLVTLCTLERRITTNQMIVIGVASGVAVLSGGLLLHDRLRRDIEPDWLRRYARGYFDRDGFCFHIELLQGPHGYDMMVMYQNRYSGNAEAELELAAPMDFLLRRDESSQLRLEMDLPGAALGCVRVPLPPEFNRSRQVVTLEVRALVRYRGPRGRRLRFRPGVAVSPIIGSVERKVRTLLPLALLPLGVHMHSRPSRIALRRARVDDSFLPQEAGQHILWLPGDSSPLIGAYEPAEHQNKGGTFPSRN